MSRSFLRPKCRTWFIGSVSVGTGSVALFAVLASSAPWSPGRFWGLIFGTLAAVVFVLDGLYPLRRRLMGWPFGTAQRWLQFHIYGGALALLFVLIHVGFSLPNGQFGWWLFGLTLWSVVSGLVGVWLQKWIPTVLASQLSVEALYDRIPEMADRLQSEADAVARGASDLLERFYSGEIRPSLAGVAPSWTRSTACNARCVFGSRCICSRRSCCSGCSRCISSRSCICEDCHTGARRGLRASSASSATRGRLEKSETI